MSQAAVFPPLDIAAYWQGVHDDLLRIIDLFPEGKLNFTPKENLWNARGILIHVADARDGWLTHTVQDGEAYPNIWTTARTRDDLKRELTRTFERLQRFVGNKGQLDATYEDDENGERVARRGHWIAFHLLEHDIHHRAELLQRLAHLDVEHGIDF